MRKHMVNEMLRKGTSVAMAVGLAVAFAPPVATVAAAAQGNSSGADIQGDNVVAKKSSKSSAKAEYEAASEELESAEKLVSESETALGTAESAYSDAEQDYQDAEADADTAFSNAVADANSDLQAKRESRDICADNKAKADSALEKANSSVEELKAEIEKRNADKAAADAEEASAKEKVADEEAKWAASKEEAQEAYDTAEAELAKAGYDFVVGKSGIDPIEFTRTYAQEMSESDDSDKSDYGKELLAALDDGSFKEQLVETLSYDNLVADMKFIDECNTLRADSTNIKGSKGALNVSYALMVYSAINNVANYGTYVHAHVLYRASYSGVTPNATAENLAWWYDDPYDGWYTAEKKKYEAGTDDYSSTGHYQNMVDALEDHNATGMTKNNGTYEQCFAYTDDSGATVTTSEFMEDLEGTVASAKEKVDSAKTALDSANEKPESLADAESAFDDAADKAASCEALLASSQTSLERAYEDQADAEKAVAEAAEALDESEELLAKAEKRASAAPSIDRSDPSTYEDTFPELAVLADKEAAAKVKMDEAKKAVDSAKASLDAARTKLSNAKSRYDDAKRAYEMAGGIVSSLGVYQGGVISESAVDSLVTSLKSDKDPADSTFSLLQAKATKVKKSSVKVKWSKVADAEKYLLYGNKCGKGKKYKKLGSFAGTSYTQKKLRKGTYYKYLVVAVGSSGNAIAMSKTVHVATKGGKVGNYKSVKVTNAKKARKLKKGKSVKLKAKAYRQSKRLKVKKHRKLAFESMNTDIATVSKSGKVKAKGKGTTYVFVYAQNGVFAKVKVTVK